MRPNPKRADRPEPSEAAPAMFIVSLPDRPSKAPLSVPVPKYPDAKGPGIVIPREPPAEKAKVTKKPRNRKPKSESPTAATRPDPPKALVRKPRVRKAKPTTVSPPVSVALRRLQSG